MVAIDPVTTSEAQFLTGRSEKEINRAIDRGEVDKIVEVVQVGASGRAVMFTRSKVRTSGTRVLGGATRSGVKKTIRKIGMPELLFLAVEGEVHEDLTPAGRKRLYAMIKAQPANAKTVSMGSLEVNVAKAGKVIADRFRKLRAVRSDVVARTGADPVMKGTEISVYRVAALAQGQTMEEIMEDYPSLSSRQIEHAIAYASAYPKPGRPYPARSLKRAAGALADAGIFDYVDDAAGDVD